MRKSIQVSEDTWRRAAARAAALGMTKYEYCEAALLYAINAPMARVKVIETRETKGDTDYCVGKTDDGRWFFSWGEWPEDELIPAHNVPTASGGVQYHGHGDEGKSAALDAMQEILE